MPDYQVGASLQHSPGWVALGGVDAEFVFVAPVDRDDHHVGPGAGGGDGGRGLRPIPPSPGPAVVLGFVLRIRYGVEGQQGQPHPTDLADQRLDGCFCVGTNPRGGDPSLLQPGDRLGQPCRTKVEGMIVGQSQDIKASIAQGSDSRRRSAQAIGTRTGNPLVSDDAL